MPTSPALRATSALAASTDNPVKSHRYSGWAKSRSRELRVLNSTASPGATSTSSRTEARMSGAASVSTTRAGNAKVAAS